MACFTVPLATAVVASAAKAAVPASARSNPFVAKLGWLGKMMFGGSFLLAIEHVYHGEITFTAPFLTAVREGTVTDMLHEMATRGVAMAVLLGVVWVAIVGVSTLLERSKASAAQGA